MGIRILTDSVADIPKEITKELNIEVLPLTVSFEDGRVIFDNKVRGNKKAIKWIINWLKVNEINLDKKTIGLIHSNNNKYLMDLHKEITENFSVKEIIESKVGSVVGTHAGPGCIAIALVK